MIFHTDNMHYSTFIQGFLLPQKSILIIPLPRKVNFNLSQAVATFAAHEYFALGCGTLFA